MFFKVLGTFFFYLLFLANSYAQSCGPEFEDIDLACIRKLDAKFVAEKTKEKKRAKVLKREEENPKSTVLKRAQLQRNLVFAFPRDELERNKLKNNIYFYQTSSGNLGKLIIDNIRQTRLSCSLLVRTVTFNKNDGVKKTSTFSIRNESNSWSVDRESFDNAGGTDFVLERQHGLCVLKKVHGSMVFAKKLVIEEEFQRIDILFYASQFLIGLAVFLVVRTIFMDEDKFKAQEKLEDAEQDEKRTVPNDIVLKYSRPFFKRYFTPVVQGMKNKRKIKEKYKRALASSGMNKFLTPEDFFAFKLFLIIGFPIVFLGLREFLEESWPLTAVPLLSVFGYFYPDIWIKGKIDQRRTEVILAMPFVVDMLALSVEAGLDFVAAIQKVIEKAPQSALVEEFETFIKETRVGSSRAEALRNLSWRIDSLPVASFCATLIAADAVGANIGPILKTLAGELRQKRSSLAEQKGAQAATKILLPMIGLVLPAVMVIIAAPVAIELMGN